MVKAEIFMKNNLLEICCGSLDDVLAAEAGGADRVELNSALYLGGLTPSTATLILAKQQSSLPIICMVRPRGAGFCYSEKEMEVIFLEARELLRHGADGLAFGFLNEDKTINVEKTSEMIKLIHEFNGEAVFHRAFDCTVDMMKACEQLIALGCDRILTSGQGKTVLEGLEALKQLQETYGNQIEILAGCGVNAENASEIMHKTGIRQLHTSAKYWKIDPTTNYGAPVNYAYINGDFYDSVDVEKVKRFQMTNM